MHADKVGYTYLINKKLADNVSRYVICVTWYHCLNMLLPWNMSEW